MLLIAKRMLAGTLAVLLLPLAALAGGNDASAPAKNTPASETTAAATPAAPAVGANAASDPLLQLLVSKGILSTTEASGLAATPANQVRDQLLLLLKAKGVLSADDLNSLKTPAAIEMTGLKVAPSTAANPAMISSPSVTSAPVAAGPSDAQGGGGPDVIPALMPVRVLPVDTPKREAVLPSISIGKNIHIQPYGFVKVSAVYD